MCLTWFSFKRKPNPINFLKNYECSCDLCYKNFKNMEELIVHMGCHRINDINSRLLKGYGTVRCNKCFKSFHSVRDMCDHPCAINTIPHLSTVKRSGSLSSVVIHE